MSLPIETSELKIVYQAMRSAESLKQTVGRLSQGTRHMDALEDAGAYKQSLLLSNKTKRAEQTKDNLLNLLSYTQSQDDALDYAAKIIQRMNALAQLSLDLTKRASDRIAYDYEFQELSNELESLKESEFNQLNLFINDPIFGETKKQFIEVLQSQWLSAAEQTVSTRLGIEGRGTNIVSIEVPEDDSYPMIWSYDTEAKTLEDGTVVEEFKVQLYLDTYIQADFPIQSPSDSAERYNVTLMTQLVMADNFYYNALANGDSNKNGQSSGGGDWFKDGVSQFVHGGDYLVQIAGGFNQGLVNAVGTGDYPSSSTAQSASNYVAVRYLHEKLKSAGNPEGIKDMLVWMSDRVASGDTPANSSIGGALVALIPADYSDSSTANDEFLSDYISNALSSGLNINLLDDDTGAIGGSNADGQSEIDHAEAVPDYPASAATENPLAGFQEEWEEEGEQLFTANIAGENIIFETVKLETENDSSIYNLTTIDSAMECLDYAERLLESVGDERARVGANLQNLTFQYENLSNHILSFQGSLERISGLDIARESVVLAKQQIRLQAHTSILKESQKNTVNIENLLSGVKVAPNEF